MNSVAATLTFVVTAVTVTVMAMSDSRNNHPLCRDVRQGSIIDVMNCRHVGIATPKHAPTAASPVLQASLGRPVH